MRRDPTVVDASPGSSDVSGLSERERQVRTLVAAGFSDKRIASMLNISYWTVRSHLTHIFRKSAVQNRMELVAQFHGVDCKTVNALVCSATGAASGVAVDWQALTHSLVHGFSHGLMVADEGENILYVNPAFSRITGFDTTDVIGRTPRLLSSGRQDGEFYRDMWRSLKNDGVWNGEVWNRRKDGTEYLQWLDIRVLEGAGNARYLALSSDITERRLEEDRIRHSAFHCALTGLANRMLLRDRGEHEIARARRSGRRLGVLFIDLNGFKLVNDAYGHKAGDRVLVEIAHRLREICRAEDTLARLGGDEFVALLPDLVGVPDSIVVADKMADACRRPVTTVDGATVIIGASIGMSIFPEDGERIDELIAHADAAMYRAKASGGGVRHYHRDDRYPAGALREAANRLHAAVERDELEIVFHPRIDLFRGALIGAEARLHWRDSGRIATTEYDLPFIAEYAGVVPRMVGRLLRRACDTLQSLRTEGHDGVHMAVDLSSHPSHRDELMAEVVGVLEGANGAARGLWLEIDESLLRGDAVRIKAQFGRLHEIGVSVVATGFGRERFWLAGIEDVPFVTAIKLDRGLVGNICANRHDGAAAHAMIRFSECLDLGVVADGVAGCSDCDALRKMGCRIGQGVAYGEVLDEPGLVRHAGAAWCCPSSTEASPCQYLPAGGPFRDN